MDLLVGFVGVLIGYVLAQASTSLAARNRAASEDEATFDTLSAWLWRNEDSLNFCLKSLSQEIELIGENKTLAGPVTAPMGGLLLFLMPRLPHEMAKDGKWLSDVLAIATGTDFIITAIEHRNLHATTNRALSSYPSILKALDEDIARRAQEVLNAVKAQSELLANRKPERQLLPWLFRG